MYFHRILEEKLVTISQQFLVVLLTGPRQVICLCDRPQYLDAMNMAIPIGIIG